jgi:acetyl esterase/lipase
MAIISSLVLTILLGQALPQREHSSRLEEPTLKKDIAYATVDGKALHLDLMRPPKPSKPAAWVLWLHGGGWRQGDRKDYHAAMRDLARLGYAGASVEYRLAPVHKFPAALEDVRNALAFLRAHAVDYELDRERVAVAGGSAGGHLALMLGLTKNGRDENGTGVRAVVDISGPTDFRTWTIAKEPDGLLKKSVGVDLNELIADFVGTSDRNDRRMMVVSPLSYVSKQNPAVLIIHGTADSWVPFQQAQTLYDALKQAGVKARLAPFEGGSHFADFWPPEQKAKARQLMIQFLDEELRLK